MQVSDNCKLARERVEQEELIADKLKKLILQSMDISLDQLNEEHMALMIDSVNEIELTEQFRNL